MRKLLCLLAFVLSAGISRAQVSGTGAYPYSSIDVKGFDSINLGNLNAHFSVPVLNKSGRGLSFNYNLTYDSTVWYPLTVNGSKVWTPTQAFGWKGDTEVATGYVSLSSVTNVSQTTGCVTILYSNFAYHDPFGIRHVFNGSATYASCNGTTPNLTSSAQDGSGYTLNFTQTSGTIISAADGRTYAVPTNSSSASAKVTDNNGNQLSADGNGHFTDTSGRVVLTVSGAAPNPHTFTYTDFSGTSRAISMSYKTYTVRTAFGCSGIGEYGSTSTSLVDAISYPDASAYHFTYEATPGATDGAVTGRLASVTLPAGGTIHYAYSGGCSGSGINSDGTITGITRSTTDGSKSYLRSNIGTSATTTTVTDELKNASVYQFAINGTAAQPYETHRQIYQGSTSGTLLWDQYTCYNTAAYPCASETVTLPISQIDTYTVHDGSNMSGSTSYFNTYGLQTEQETYDYGSSSTARGGVLAIQNWAYPSSGNVSLMSYTSSLDGAGHLLAKTAYGYDETTPTSTSGLPQHVAASGQRGNLTTTTQYTQSAVAAAIITKMTYDDAGQLRSITDVRNHQTTFTYDTGTDGLLQQTATISTSPLLQTTKNFETNTGLLSSTVDANGRTTTLGYDSMLRLNATGQPDGGTQSLTYSVYANANTPATVVAKVLHNTGGSYISSTQTLDGYGRVSNLTQADSNPAGNDLVDYQYDATGRLYTISNPYRSKSETTYGVTTYHYDALGRTLSIQKPDTSAESSTYAANTTTTKDEMLNPHRYVTDGLGRLTQVLEPDGTGTLNYATQYLYIQNYSSTAATYQTIVQQKGNSTDSTQWRTRTFTTDLLGRTVQEITPEAGQISYNFTNSGYCAGDITLPCTRVDALGWTTTYSYDLQNRLIGKLYSGGTPATPGVTYSYDQSSFNGLTITNPLGHRTGMVDGSGQTAYSYDLMGRVAANRKTLGSLTAQANYNWNPDGTLNTLQDFGGSTLTYSYDSAGRQTGVFDSVNTYASSTLYDAAGQLASMTNMLTSSGGNFSRTLQYDDRLNLHKIVATLNSAPVQSFTYAYNAAPNNNGNITGISNDLNSSRTQTFHYDTMNRILDAGDAAHWGQQYTYDQWGNMTSHTTTKGSGYTWTVSTTMPHNQLPTETYDADGRVTRDAQGTSFTYDAEGRALTGGSGIYTYDGDGYRVKKTLGGTTTLYWPSSAAGIIDESDSGAINFGKQIYVAGVQVWSEDITKSGKILFQDHLGSTRLVASANGSLNDDYDYGPFGDVVGNYTSNPSDIHYRFIGDETDSTDSATNYLNFRNLSYPNSRFNRPDPYDGSYDFTDPQSFNRYSYVKNNPLKYSDPLGLTDCPDNNGCTYDDGGCIYSDACGGLPPDNPGPTPEPPDPPNPNACYTPVCVFVTYLPPDPPDNTNPDPGLSPTVTNFGGEAPGNNSSAPNSGQAQQVSLSSNNYLAGVCVSLGYQRVKTGCLYVCEAASGVNFSDVSVGPMFFTPNQILNACGVPNLRACPATLIVEAHHTGLLLPGEISIKECSPFGAVPRMP